MCKPPALRILRRLGASASDRSSCARSPGPVARYVYNVDYGRILDTLSGHDDAVSSIRLRESTLVTASWDSTIKVRARMAWAPFYCITR